MCLSGITTMSAFASLLVARVYYVPAEVARYALKLGTSVCLTCRVDACCIVTRRCKEGRRRLQIQAAVIRVRVGVGSFHLESIGSLHPTRS